MWGVGNAPVPWPKLVKSETLLEDELHKGCFKTTCTNFPMKQFLSKNIGLQIDCIV